MSVNETVIDDVNSIMGVATGEEIELILQAHRARNFFKLLNLKDVPIGAMGQIDWSGHDAIKTNEIAIRCKLLSLRLDRSRNAHPKAFLASRAVQNVLDLMSLKETRREFLSEVETLS